MKFFITGGCGFLGSNLSAHILKLGHELFIFDNLSRHGSEQNREWLKQQGDFALFQEDIRNEEKVARAIELAKPDVVFHLCGQVTMTRSLEDPRYDFEVNALGAINILEAIKTHAPNAKLIFSSTNKVYGDLEDFSYVETNTRYEVGPPKQSVRLEQTKNPFDLGFDESLPLHFSSPYGCSKGAADQYILDAHKIFGLQTVVFRHSSIFGGRQFATFDQGWVGWFVEKALETKKGVLPQGFTIAGNGKQVRDILFADDLIRCYFSALENIQVTAGQVYNIGGGMKNSFSLLELFSFLESQIGVELKFEKTPWRKSDQKVFVANTAKAFRDFHWAPQITKETGVNNMIEWVRSRG